jgi:antitoxin component of MazEF toxin-antitoxin module
MGKNLAVRVPFDIAKTTGLRDGERVEIEAHDGDIVIRRPAAHEHADALAAAEEIIGESLGHSLGDVTLHELIDEGRRGSKAHNLTLYDAAYLELAIRRRQALASRDAALVGAAKIVGVEVLCD